MNQNTNEDLSGKMENMGVLDLTSIEDVASLKTITGIKNVGTVLVPESFMEAAMSLPMKNVGAVVPIPVGENVKVRTGQITMGGRVLASGDPDSILVVVGQLFIDSTVEKIGYKELQLTGQIIAPRRADSILENAITKLKGQIAYYQGKPKLLMGNQTISRDFFEYIKEPVSLILLGEFDIIDEVPVELIKEKVEEIILLGDIMAPANIVSILQFLANVNMGEIKAIDEEKKDY